MSKRVIKSPNNSPVQILDSTGNLAASFDSSTMSSSLIKITPTSADPVGVTQGTLQFADGTARTEGLWQYKSTGWSNVQGNTGIQGTQGNTGIQGIQGTTGILGINGTQGDTGIQGIQGNTGVGIQGATGISGTGGGSSTGYITNSDILVDTSGYATYADAAAATPTDGTGGSPNVTIARNTTNPIWNIADLLFTKDAANRQGQGFSCDFSIYSSDQARPLKFSFRYKVSSNYSYSNNDVVLYIYDVTNAVMIQPTPYVLDGSGLFVGEFQTSANSTSYRAIWHIATTNASAWTMNVSHVDVSATPVPSMLNLKDKLYDISSYISSSVTTDSAYGSVSLSKDKSGIWYMTGLISVNVNPTGNWGSIPVYISGVSINTTGTNHIGTSIWPYIGSDGVINSGSFTVYASAVQSAGAYTFTIHLNALKLNSMPTWAADYYPVQLNDGAETRVVAAQYGIGGTFTVTAGELKIINFNSKLNDTHGSVTTGASWKFTAQVSGYYLASVGLLNAYPYTNGVYGDLFLYKNGSQYAQMDRKIGIGAGGVFVGGQNGLFLNAGDYIDFRFKNNDSGTVTVDASSVYYSCSIMRMSGPATIAASEKVYAIYAISSSTSNSSIAASSTEVLDYDTKIEDSHVSVTTGASWKFTAQKSALYMCMASSQQNGTNAGNATELYLYKNGAKYAKLAMETIGSTTEKGNLSGGVLVKLNVGDYIQFLHYNGEGSARSIDTTANSYLASIYSI